MTQQINRRTVTKGIAWSVPAVAFASAAPALASSPIDVEVEHVYGTACKLPGRSCYPPLEKGYAFAVRICNPHPFPVTVNMTSAMIRMGDQPAVSWNMSPSSFQIGAATEAGATCEIVKVSISGEPSSQNVSLNGTVSYDWSGGDLDGSGTFEVSAPATPPCDNCEVPREFDDGDYLDTGDETSTEETATPQTTDSADAEPLDESTEALTEEDGVEAAVVEEPAEELTEPVSETQPVEATTEAEGAEEDQ